MITIQVVPNGSNDAYKLLRDKVSHEANTWSWANKGKTKLVHVNSDGYIEVGSAEGILVARIFPKKNKANEFYLSEKFLGRLVAWFQSDLAAINVQFVADPSPKKINQRTAARSPKK